MSTEGYFPRYADLLLSSVFIEHFVEAPLKRIKVWPCDYYSYFLFSTGRE